MDDTTRFLIQRGILALPRLNGLDFETLGYGIVALFLIAWVSSVAIFRMSRIEERWTGLSGE